MNFVGKSNPQLQLASLNCSEVANANNFQSFFVSLRDAVDHILN